MRKNKTRGCARLLDGNIATKFFRCSLSALQPEWSYRNLLLLLQRYSWSTHQRSTVAKTLQSHKQRDYYQCTYRLAAATLL
jgi:hypothetical protein